MKKSLGAKTLVWPAPVFLVGSYDDEDKPNVMNAAWGGICSSEPSAVAVSVRPSRRTYEGIMRHKAFTVSIPSARLTREADLTGIVSGSRLDKFTACGFTPIRSEHVDAPYIEECPLVIELELLHAINLGSHVQFTGIIKDVKIDPDCLDEAGNPCLALADPILFDPALRNYHRVGEIVGKAFSAGKELLKLPE